MGRQAVLTADSGTWHLQTDSTMYFDLMAAAPGFIGDSMPMSLASTVHNAGAAFITPGTYPVEDPLAYGFQMVALGRFVGGRSTSGTITITVHDSTILAGRINVTFFNWRGVDAPAFTLRGPFRLTRDPS